MPRQFRRPPRRRRELTPEEREIRRTRVTPYQARIERRLTDVYLEVPETRQADAEWIFTHAVHINGYTTCELCGHNPIRRLFFMRHRSTGRELCVGSECIRNYVNVDLVNAYLRRMTREQGRIRERREHDANLERVTENLRRVTAASRERRQRLDSEGSTWRANNQDIITWLEDNVNAYSSTFLRDINAWLRHHGQLTENQTRAVRDIMNERPMRANPVERPTDAEASNDASRPTESSNLSDVELDEEPATVNDVVGIPNGVFALPGESVDRNGILIWTVEGGRLQGKRIVKYWDQHYGAWKGFAFLTLGGRLKKWRNSNVPDEMVGVANAILLRLRVRDPLSLPLGIALRHCRVCNTSLPRARYREDSFLCVRHDPRSAPPPVPLDSTTTARRNPYRYDRYAARRTPPQGEAISELGTGEIL